MDKFSKEKTSVRLPKPVISVGNLTWGGTGKTPLQIKLISDLLAQRKRPAVLTRGYKGAGRQNGVIGYNDEVALMRKYFPGVPFGVGSNRVVTAQKIMGAYPIDLFVLDDGFQHWRLKRDLDIVCVDATNPWGGGHLIPWGALREPISGLKRAQVVVLTRSELVSDIIRDKITDEIAQFMQRENIFTSYFSHQLFSWKDKLVDLSSTLNGSRVLAVSAIGNPRSFEENLRSHGADVVPFRFPDHYPFADSDLLHIEKRMKKERAMLVVTEKDETKLKKTRWGFSHGGPGDLYVLRARVQFSYDEEVRWEKAISHFVHG